MKLTVLMLLLKIILLIMLMVVLIMLIIGIIMLFIGQGTLKIMPEPIFSFSGKYKNSIFYYL